MTFNFDVHDKKNSAMWISEEREAFTEETAYAKAPPWGVEEFERRPELLDHRN